MFMKQAIRAFPLSHWSENPIAVLNHTICDLVSTPVGTRLPSKADILNFSTQGSHARAVVIHEHLDFIEIVYVQSGNGIAIVGDQEYPIQHGDILIVPPHCPHGNIPLPNLSVSNCLFSISLLRSGSGLLKPPDTTETQLPFPPIIHPSGTSRLHIENLFERLAVEQDQHDLYFQEGMLYLLNELIILLCRTLQSTNSTSKKRDISSTLEYINAHYDTITLSEAAAISSYHSTYFCRLFHAATGQYFTDYVNKLRVKHAITMLTDTDMSVENIALIVGFKSKVHFYDVFNKYTGTTPGKFRETLK